MARRPRGEQKPEVTGGVIPAHERKLPVRNKGHWRLTPRGHINMTKEEADEYDLKQAEERANKEQAKAIKDKQSEDEAEAAKKAIITPADALYGFVAWCTSRDQAVVMSSHDAVVPVVDLLFAYCKINNLGQVSENYPGNLVYPEPVQVISNLFMASPSTSPTPATTSEPVDKPQVQMHVDYSAGQDASMVHGEEGTVDGRSNAAPAE